MHETHGSLEAYVTAALALQGYRLDDAHVQRVVAQFARIEAIARGLDAQPLAFEANAAAVFRP